ncbi:hypothetical protein BJX68DRAFT_263137 [Aspergillus pseudodeflectus]|uniref:Uncharacterized protein n=1 Tax=Aspergillus pseudodeflectus TaxID=176178 RepID=A0ABR4KZ58_9EURO
MTTIPGAIWCVVRCAGLHGTDWLRELRLHGAWQVSPALFGACGVGGETASFLDLKGLEVSFPIVAYDGCWLFGGNPGDVRKYEDDDVPPCLDPPISYDGDMDFELPSDYEDELEYYSADLENRDNPQHK